jgi:hypothetical protein
VSKQLSLDLFGAGVCAVTDALWLPYRAEIWSGLADRGAPFRTQSDGLVQLQWRSRSRTGHMVSFKALDARVAVFTDGAGRIDGFESDAPDKKLLRAFPGWAWECAIRDAMTVLAVEAVLHESPPRCASFSPYAPHIRLRSRRALAARHRAHGCVERAEMFERGGLQS